MGAKEELNSFAESCIRCGLCARTNCGNYGAGVNLGAIAESLLKGEATFNTFPLTCALCNRCTADCPADLKAFDMCVPGRALLLERDPSLKPMYRHFRTDLKNNMFQLVQALNNGDITDVPLITEHPALGTPADHTAFFPGCSLATYSPELTATTLNWLREKNIAAQSVLFCCGSIPHDSGFPNEFDSFRKGVVAFLKKKGINRLVIACPHCGHILPMTLEGSGIAIEVLPELLLRYGVKVKTRGNFSVHDACYDREDQRFGKAVRKLLASCGSEVPLASSGKHTICCGGGGMVSVYAPAFCEWRRNQKTAEIDAAVNADFTVSTCFSCVNSLQRGPGFKPMRHYLELAFDMDVNWAGVYRGIDAMYAHPQANSLLANDEPLFA